jgi:hypothetical protein
MAAALFLLTLTACPLERVAVPLERLNWYGAEIAKLKTDADLLIADGRAFADDLRAWLGELAEGGTAPTAEKLTEFSARWDGLVTRGKDLYHRGEALWELAKGELGALSTQAQQVLDIIGTIASWAR